MRTPRMFLTLLCAGIVAFGAYAQENPPPPKAPSAANVRPGGHAEDPELQALIEQVMAARLAKQLGLNDEQTVVMLRRFSEFREETQGLRKERQAIIKALKVALRDGRPEPEIEGKLNELLAHDAKADELKKTAYEKACANLNVSQRARLYVFLNEFESDMRRLVQKARERNAQRWGRLEERPETGQQPGPPRQGRSGIGRPRAQAPAEK